jgi:hypothetical protein
MQDDIVKGTDQFFSSKRIVIPGLHISIPVYNKRKSPGLSGAFECG